MAPFENIFLQNITILFSPKSFLINLQLFDRNINFPLTLHIQIQTVFQSHYLSLIHICKKTLIIHWMTKPRKYIILLLSNTTRIVNYSSWLRNQLFFDKHKNGIFQKLITNLHLVLKLPLMQNFLKISILNVNLSRISISKKNVWRQQINWRNIWIVPR